MQQILLHHQNKSIHLALIILSILKLNISVLQVMWLSIQDWKPLLCSYRFLRHLIIIINNYNQTQNLNCFSAKHLQIIHNNNNNPFSYNSSNNYKNKLYSLNNNSSNQKVVHYYKDYLWMYRNNWHWIFKQQLSNYSCSNNNNNISTWQQVVR